MNDNPYPNASDTMHYELHTAWDEGYAEGFAAGRAAATPDQPGELVSRARYAAHLAAATPGPREDAVTTIVRVLNRTMDLTARERAVAVLASIPAGLSGKTSDEKTGECRAPHCWSEYGTPCGTCPAVSPAPPRKRSASASDPMPLCNCEFCTRPLRDHDEEGSRMSESMEGIARNEPRCAECIARPFDVKNPHRAEGEVHEAWDDGATVGFAAGRAALPDPPPVARVGPNATGANQPAAALPDERLREALAFYANKSNYTAQNPVGSGAHVWRDMGQRARAALAAADREENTDG